MTTDDPFAELRVMSLPELLRWTADRRADYSGAEVETEVAAFRSAAALAEGDLRGLYGLLPSWHWTPGMTAALTAPTPAPGSTASA